LKDNTNMLFNGPRIWMFPRNCRFYRNAYVISKVQMLLQVTSYFFLLVTFARNTTTLQILNVQNCVKCVSSYVMSLVSVRKYFVFVN